MKFLFSIALAMFLVLTSFVPASHAARIYNYTNQELGVGSYTGALDSTPSHFIEIPAGERSDSLSWTSDSTYIKVVTTAGLPYCSVDSGRNNDIQGGNYMKIEKKYRNCFVCDSNNEPISGDGDC